MAAPKKGLLGIIMGGDKPPGDDAEESGGNAVQDALKDLARAMSAKDWAGAEQAFRDAKAACDDDYASEEDSEEEL